jgi:hypothetical protein
MAESPATDSRDFGRDPTSVGAGSLIYRLPTITHLTNRIHAAIRALPRTRDTARTHGASAR